jgi:hypothetical protein
MKIRSLPHIGRPTKKPSELKLNQLGAFTLAVPEARAILKKTVSKYPPCPTIYSEDTRLGLIIEFLQTPGILDATWKPKSKAHEQLQSVNQVKAIQWAKMFAEAPLIMMDALPKIHKCLNKWVNSPLWAVVHYFSHKHDLQRFYGEDDFCERFWTEKATTLAGELKGKLKLPITGKTIEKARKILS